ncbi:MAG: hypothetical protein Q8P44_02335 [Dehalococcoidia bacterium]|nr:hypothetical protein [Dehalococcoidia bacterium]
MRYYIVTTTKFAEQCLAYLTYGATQSNWLANLDIGDTIFLSQFNYKTQQIFGPLNVTKRLFYNKTLIYPMQRYFYRVQFSSGNPIYAIEETDLYLYGVHCNEVSFYSRIINLIQQNKHLHCIPLTNREGEALLNAIQELGTEYQNSEQKTLIQPIIEVNQEYIWGKNKLDKKHKFASESDLETYLLLSLKIKGSYEYDGFNEALANCSRNRLEDSVIYNQFILGNAYPADIVVVNAESINVFELKKDSLTSTIAPQIEKEMRKHLCYSILSERVTEGNPFKDFNFYLVCLCGGNHKTKVSISNMYKSLKNRIRLARKSNLIFLEYNLTDNGLSFLHA